MFFINILAETTMRRKFLVHEMGPHPYSRFARALLRVGAAIRGGIDELKLIRPLRAAKLSAAADCRAAASQRRCI